MFKFDWNMLFTLINLLVFFILMKVFLFKPIKKTLDERKKLIDDKFNEAEQAKADAEKLKEEYARQLEDAEEEKNRIMDEARAEAKEEYGKTIERAKADAQKIISDADRTARLEAQSTKNAAKQEIAQVAMLAAQKVVGREISPDTDSDIYDEFLNESSDE